MKCASLGVVLLRVSFLLSGPVQAQVSFFQPPAYAGSGSVFLADFNGDGKPDILTSDGTLNLGNGDGTFTPGTHVSGSSVDILAVADFNGDGKPDLLEQGTGTLLVLLGNGDGTFQAPISTASGASLSLLTAGDLNGDGKADVVGVFNSTLIVYTSNGDGTFASGVAYNIGSTGAGLLLLGNFSGQIDVALNANGNELVFLGNGDGTFQTTPKTSAAVSGQNVVAGDFNNDGKLDLAIASGEVCNATCTLASVDVLPGNGDGTFGTAIAPISAYGPLAAADLNGDGKLDIVVATSSYSVQVYLGNGDFTFSNSGNYFLSAPLIASSASIAPVAADFNLDGKPDLAADGFVLLGNGDGTFQANQLGVLPQSALPGPTVVGDFANKHIPYAAMASSQTLSSNTTQYTVDIFANDGKGALSLVQTYTLQEPGYGIVTADFNGDGNLDLLVVGTDPVSQDWSYSVLLGNGNGTFQSAVFYTQNVMTASSTYSIVVGDFNKDGKVDIALSPGGPGTLAVLLGNGDGTFSAPVYYYDGGGGSIVAADFNGDGKLDLAAAAGSGTAILLGNGDGTFQNAVFPPSLNGFYAKFTADVNSDSKADLISLNQVALGNGDGTFTLLPPLFTSAGIVALGDLNGDGRLDLLVQTAMFGKPAGDGVQLGNGDGTFGSLITLSGNGVFPLSTFLADMNGDGRPDIVAPGPAYLEGGVNGVGVVFNTTPPGFALTASVLSPATVTAGSSATSTASVTPTFGFTGTVTLSCIGLPSGASCTFNPPSIANSSGNSALTITTSASLAAGTYAVHVQGTSGSIVNTAAVSLVVQAAPDFSINTASGSPTSQTVTAGQTASFSLALAPTGSFTGTVSLSCAITPVVTPALTCGLPSGSVQITGNGTQTVTVKVGTTAPVTSTYAPHLTFPTGPMPLVWSLAFLGSAWLWLRSRKRLAALIPTVTLAFVFSMGCGGSGSSPTHTTPGTPAGTYTATVTATSGSTSHNIALQVVVQ